MYSVEIITLSSKFVGGIQVYPIVEIRLFQGPAGYVVQVVPAAIVFEAMGEVFTFLIGDIKTSDVQSAG